MQSSKSTYRSLVKAILSGTLLLWEISIQRIMIVWIGVLDGSSFFCTTPFTDMLTERNGIEFQIECMVLVALPCVRVSRVTQGIRLSVETDYVPE